MASYTGMGKYGAVATRYRAAAKQARRWGGPNSPAAKRFALAARRAEKRKAAAKAMTMTKKSKPLGRIYQHGECSYSYYKHTDHKLTPVVQQAIKPLSIKHYTYVEGSNVDIPDGQQHMQILGTFFHGPELDEMVKDSGTWGTTPAYSRDNTKLIILGGQAKVAIANHSSATLKFTLWDLLRRRDSESSAAFEVLQGYGRITGSTQGALLPDSTATMSPDFRMNLFQLKKTVFCLSPGQIHYHTLKMDINKIWKHELYGTTSNSYYRGWTYEILCQCQGTPSCDTLGANVTTSDGGYNFIVSRRHKFKIMMDNSYQGTSTGSNLPAFGTITTRNYNQDTSAPADVNTDD